MCRNCERAPKFDPRKPIIFNRYVAFKEEERYREAAYRIAANYSIPAMPDDDCAEHKKFYFDKCVMDKNRTVWMREVPFNVGGHTTNVWHWQDEDRIAQIGWERETIFNLDQNCVYAQKFHCSLPLSMEPDHREPGYIQVYEIGEGFRLYVPASEYTDQKTYYFGPALLKGAKLIKIGEGYMDEHICIQMPEEARQAIDHLMKEETFRNIDACYTAIFMAGLKVLMPNLKLHEVEVNVVKV